jgi:quercetin dioxygenase-like cupin family protein
MTERSAEGSRTGRDAPAWIDGAEFHLGEARVHRARPGEPAALVKRRSDMAHVLYSPANPSPSAPGWMAGSGGARTVWLASEQPGSAEGLIPAGLRGAFDTYLEPGAAVGWHQHPVSEEMYLVLTGELTVRVGDGPPADAAEFVLAPGDTHRIPVGWWHAARAGAEGVRFVVVEWFV